MLKRFLNAVKAWFGVGRVAGFALLGVFVFIRVLDPAPLEAFRFKVFDYYQWFKPRESPPQPIAIVDIDEASLKEFGQWPWARTRVADLVTRIAQAGAVVIAFDIVFAEPDRLSPNRVANDFRGLDDETRAKLNALPNNDVVLASIMRQTRVVVGQSGHHEESVKSDTGDPPQSSIATLGAKPDPYLFSYPGLLQNVPELEAQAKGRGLLTTRPDFDGLIRRVPLVMKARGKIYPGFATEILRVATGSNAVLIKTDDAGISSVVVAGVQVPTDPNGRLWVYFNRHDKNRFVSAKDVFNDPAAAQRLRGKLVLIGTSAVGLFDVKSTPLDPTIPGVEVHAQVIENILTKSFLNRPNYAVGVEVLLAIALGIAIIALVPVLGPVPVLLLGGTIAVITAGLSGYLFIKWNMLIDVAYPLISSFAVFSLLSFINYVREEMERRQVRGAFSRYISPALVEQLAEDPDKLVLGGETRDITILFSDVRGFTSISELYKGDPQGLTTLMNRFLTPLSNAIIEQNGTIDKYMGDAIMAFWNAPLDDPDHAARACDAALIMLDRLVEVNREREAEAKESGQPFLPLNAGIGINTGECVVGNMGSDLRFDYSVLGDSVNLASRLEGQTKGYGVNIIIGAHTAELVGDRFATLELDRIRVKGKTEPETIFAIIGAGEVAREDGFRAAAERLAELLGHYRGCRWEEAAAALDDLRGIGKPYELDTLCDVYAERIALFRETPPAGDWDGVWTMETK